MSNAASKGGFVKSWENKQKIQKMKDIIVWLKEKGEMIKILVAYISPQLLFRT